MDISRFCNNSDLNIKGVISSVISPLFLDVPEINFINEYSNLTNRPCQYTISSINKYLPEVLSEKYNIGHDLPIWFSNSKKYDLKVLIVSQDPLRTNGIQGKLYLSTPWGIHCSKGYPRTRTGLMNYIDLPFINKYNALIYHTDYCKLYYTDSPTSSGTIQDRLQNPLVSEDKNFYKDIFNNELSLVKPDIIITLGSWINNVNLFNGLYFSPDKPLHKINGYIIYTLYHPNAHMSVKKYYEDFFNTYIK